METDNSHGQSTAAASSDHSEWEQSDAEADSSVQEESEAELQEDRQHDRHAQGQRRCRAAAESPANTTAAPGAAAGAQQHDEQALCAPYSHLLWCDTANHAQIKIANSLCTDMEGVSSSSGSGTAAVQVTVEVHAASWDVRQYILSQLQQQAPAAGTQQGQLPGAQAGSSTPGPKVFGPYAATLTRDKGNQLYFTQLQHQHEPQTYLEHLAGKPHHVVLQERVSAHGLCQCMRCLHAESVSKILSFGHGRMTLQRHQLLTTTCFCAPPTCRCLAQTRPTSSSTSSQGHLTSQGTGTAE
jgi:hypothetical protein